MPNELEIFYVPPPVPPPEPPAQVRVLRSELIHSMPAVEIFGLNAIALIRSEVFHELHPLTTQTGPWDRFIRSDLIHSMPVKDLVSWVGEPAPANPLPDSISVGVSHAF